MNFTTYEIALVSTAAIAFGIWLLVKAGDITITAAAAIAERSGLSKMFIAATIIAFGTSAPELFTSINANLSGYQGISVGNIIGSNITNILLIIGVSASITPLIINRKEVRIDTLVMLLATALAITATLAGILPRWGGISFAALIITYVTYQYRASRTEPNDEPNEEPNQLTGNPYLWVTIGILGLIIGSEILVQAAVIGAETLGVPETIIGLTLIALGTSIPELTASIAAARKQETGMIIGNIVGSNTFNVLSVMGITAITKPLIIPNTITAFDISLLAVTTTLLAANLLLKNRIPRTTGITLTTTYAAYITIQYFTTLT